MSTSTGHPEGEPIDGPVRVLFWRLRARLVRPPTEERAIADLDRVYELARRQAHATPSARIQWPRPCPSPADAARRRPGHGSTDDDDDDDGGEDAAPHAS